MVRPVLIAQGYLDARVDVRHAQAMRSKLSGSNAHVDYVEYRDTGHFLLVEKHREDFYTRLLHLLDTTIGKSRVASAAR